MIFAVIAVVLFALVGMAVDGGFSYFVSDKLERGAAAAALAGVPDMPNLAPPAANDATTTATKAAALNGWTAGGPTNVAIAVAAVPNPATPGQNYRNRLQVKISADVPVFFMKLLGFSTHREGRTAIAEYLPPITFGQPGGQLGSDLPNLGNTGTNNYYFMRSEGYGTDRGQGDAYGPNPTDWLGPNAANPADTHALNAQGEPTSQPLALPARGGASYQIFVPANQTTTLKVYNPVFAPDNGTANALGYTYHEDDGDFPETGTGCTRGSGPGTSPCSGPGSATDAKQWPTMSYTVYQSPNPFDHKADVWISNMTIKSIDGTSNPNYTIPGVTATPQPLAQLSAMYHSWMDITAIPTVPAPAPYVPLVTVNNPSSTRLLVGGANGSTYRLRVDQLDDTSGDPAVNGRVQNQQSQAHKGYAVSATGCATCTVAALNDITLYTPVKTGQFTMPLVSIPPDYQGRTFSLYVFDPGDVTCNATGCSNVITLMQPTANGTSSKPAITTDGIFESPTSSQFGGGPYINKVAGPGPAAIQTQSQNPNSNPTNLFNGRWLKFDISVPGDYATTQISSLPSSWYWSLQYNTSQPAGDTITANLGFAGAPVHIISG
ncbi:MAG: hypothetical protein JF887_14750 [Candidatus Dormibacteraeota bacterium]|uniref:Flp pilus-assembly TadG-like N-terminal domain-containing protein n=1 Tax=Candidatus Amunia macphersoniae TaxID=3127014 RepID=A0A934KHF7_9BACT|nr:hypothetical protein [Candidatus Dormibacteraeota bacterium]